MNTPSKITVHGEKWIFRISSAVISEIFISTYFNISDSEAEFSDITAQYLDIRTKYIRCLLHSWISIFLLVDQTVILFIFLCQLICERPIVKEKILRNEVAAAY